MSCNLTNRFYLGITLMLLAALVEPTVGDVINTYAGTGAAGYSGDGGPATSAKIQTPWGLAVATNGDIYFADRDNFAIRKVDGVTGDISTFAGGSQATLTGDGNLATAAWLYEPTGVAVDAAGNIFIAEKKNERVRKIDAATGIISTIAGTGVFGFSGDGGPATSAKLNQPGGVVIDAAGNVYIADKKNERIRKVAAGTGVITTFAGTGTPGFSGDGGQATSAMLNSPEGVAVDSTGNVFIADKKNQRIRKVDVATGIITTYAGTGTAGYTGDGGAATSAKIQDPMGVAVDGADDLYIADAKNNVIRKVTTATGIITTVAGTGTGGYSGDGGQATSATLNQPGGVAVDSLGNISIADKKNERVRRIDIATGVIMTIAGTGTPGYSGDGGPGTSAMINSPMGLATDAAGHVYLADSKNHVIRKIDWATGVITVVGGTPGEFTSIGDGGAATSAYLEMPEDVAIDTAGNLYIACPKLMRVRKVDASTGIISTIAGTGTAGFSGDGGAATSANLDTPGRIDVDSAGHVYIADNKNQRVRKVDSATGIISTIAGTGGGGFSGDGGAATSAKLDSPRGVAVDSAGDVFIADEKNNRIRKVTAATGIIDTVAGNGLPGYTGDGGPATSAQLDSPLGVAIDSAGNLYFVDSKNNVIRKVGSDGIITTVAGTSAAGYGGDGGDATLALLDTPSGVVIDAVNDVYLTDTKNHRLRVIDQPAGDSHHWHLNETSGTVAADSIGSSDGTLTNFPFDDSQWSCLHGGSLIFDGVDDYVSLPFESDYDFANFVTVAAWINVTSFNVAEQAVVTKGDTAYRLERNASTNTLQFSVDGLITNTVVQGSISVNDGTWHHVAGVYDGAQLLLYVDGQLDNAVTATGTMATNASAVYFGANADVAGRYFNGKMDEVSIYETALSASQIQTLAQASLLGWWKLNETSGTTAYDSSAYGYNGTLQNMAGTEWTTAKDNGGLDFSGTNDFIETNLASTMATSITMMTWFKSDDAGAIGNNRVAQRFITQRRGATKSRLALGINNDRIALYWDNGNNVVQEATTTVTAGKWYHAAITYDGTTVRLYINGVEDGNWTESSMKSPKTDTYQIGCESNGVREFDGVLDDVRLSRRALCAAEIAAIYQQMAGGVRIVNWQEVEP